jgi:hypothetical protein
MVGHWDFVDNWVCGKAPNKTKGNNEKSQVKCSTTHFQDPTPAQFKQLRNNI